MNEINIKYLLCCNTCWYGSECGGYKEIIPGERIKLTREECYLYQKERRHQDDMAGIEAECMHEDWGDR